MMPEGELALIYLIVFVLLFMAGPGRYSVDYLIDMKVSRDKEELSVHK
jgi:putative oxidoreductase